MLSFVKKITFSLFVILGFDSLQAGHNHPNYTNYWPVSVKESQTEPHQEETHILGPILEESEMNSDTMHALRPLYLDRNFPETEKFESHWLYPFFSYYETPSKTNWKMLGGLANGLDADYGDNHELSKFEIWPLYWSYQTGKPESSYRAVFPFYGTLKNRLFFSKIRWRVFPLYTEFEKKDFTDYVILYPFIRYRCGNDNTGLGIWPLGGHFEKEGSYSNTYALWPLFYNNYSHLEREIPTHNFGVLPFYSSDTAAGLKSETFLWPFFGYTNETDPRPEYHEIRYFWPFVVQGRGDEKYINRIAPFYSNLQRENYEKTWYLWPLWRNEVRVDRGLDIDRNQLLWFIWWDEQQDGINQDFHAQKSHLWPLFSYWDDGQGTVQFQTISPFEVFMPHDQEVRDLWSPLFAIYRYESTPESTSHSLLWDLLSVKTEENGYDFYLGPLFESSRNEENRKISFLSGLIEYNKSQGESNTSFLWGLIGDNSKK
jgi:hypothetical protein